MNFNFEKYPFEKLNLLFKDISFDQNKLIDLTIGEPKFDTPSFITKEICNNQEKFRMYPKSIGEKSLKQAQINFFKRRFNVSLKEEELIPTLGTREVLFNFPQFVLFDKKNPTMAYTNPFYQIYEGAAIASKAKKITLNLTQKNNFKPQIDEKLLKDVDLVIINFPNNPTGSFLLVDELKKWVELALKNNFILLNDECYSEIYFEQKPPSVLEASLKLGHKSFKNIVCVNSLTKRSSAPGIRSGFIAGDSIILKEYQKYRTYVGATGGIPLQLASALAWDDEKHVEIFRQKYAKNAQIAKEILNIDIKTTFYIWLKVKDDLKTARDLLEKYSIKVLPGTFLGRDGYGEGFVRIALVDKEDKIKSALIKIKQYMESKS